MDMNAIQLSPRSQEAQGKPQSLNRYMDERPRIQEAEGKPHSLNRYMEEGVVPKLTCIYKSEHVQFYHLLMAEAVAQPPADDEYFSTRRKVRKMSIKEKWKADEETRKEHMVEVEGEMKRRAREREQQNASSD